MKNKIILIQEYYSSLDISPVNNFLQKNPNWEVVSITPFSQKEKEGRYGLAILLKNNEII